jgi:hypothetical protein
MFPRCRTKIVSKHNRRYAGLSVCCDPFQIGELASLTRLSDSHHLTPVGYAHARSGEPIASGPLCQLETRVPQTLTRSSYAQVTRSRCHLQSLWCCYSTTADENHRISSRNKSLLILLNEVADETSLKALEVPSTTINHGLWSKAEPSAGPLMTCAAKKARSAYRDPIRRIDFYPEQYYAHATFSAVLAINMPRKAKRRVLVVSSCSHEFRRRITRYSYQRLRNST